ncbi:MAG TPA: hypothetical protein VIS06_01085 [Mycobacteriales bacterium]
MRVRHILLGVTAVVMMALGATATPAQAAPLKAQPAAATGITATDIAATGATPTAFLADPGPECNGQGGGCWEYYSWYWTYSSCHDTGRQQLQNNPGRYDNYNCAGGHGLVVWLWLHRP